MKDSRASCSNNTYASADLPGIFVALGTESAKFWSNKGRFNLESSIVRFLSDLKSCKSIRCMIFELEKESFSLWLLNRNVLAEWTALFLASTFFEVAESNRTFPSLVPSLNTIRTVLDAWSGNRSKRDDGRMWLGIWIWIPVPVFERWCSSWLSLHSNVSVYGEARTHHVQFTPGSDFHVLFSVPVFEFCHVLRFFSTHNRTLRTDQTSDTSWWNYDWIQRNSDL